MTVYLDIAGNPHRRPAGVPAEWRIGGYAVAERDGRLLMAETVLPSRWTWELPGGGIRLEPEETIVEGIAREVREETGYRFVPKQSTLCLVDDARLRPPSGAYWRILTFAVRGAIDREPASGWSPPGTEIARIAWVDPESLREDDVLPPHWSLLADLGYVGEHQP